MSHEARINDALRSLGEEYRLGMVALEEYRARRKMILATWGEREVTTSPGSLRTAELHQTGPHPALKPGVGAGAAGGKGAGAAAAKAAGTKAPAAAPAKSKAGLIVLAILIAVIAGGAAYYFLGMKPAQQQAVAALPPAPPPLNPQVVAVKKAADDFMARNVWDAEPIEAFLTQWRALSPEDRARAREEPSLKTLAYELEQNIQAESQLVAPDAPPEQRARLDLLTRFAEELKG